MSNLHVLTKPNIIRTYTPHTHRGGSKNDERLIAGIERAKMKIFLYHSHSYTVLFVLDDERFNDFEAQDLA